MGKNADFFKKHSGPFLYTGFASKDQKQYFCILNFRWKILLYLEVRCGLQSHV